MTSRHTIALLILLLIPAFVSMAQTETVDTLAYRQEAVVDSTLVGKNILTILEDRNGGEVSLHQSANVQKAFSSQLASNSSRKVSGYRVRIYSDNKQNSRGASEAALNRFKGMYPGLTAYRTYTNPFFKVTVGDFRTKSEALALLRQIKGSFPTAFIVAETINYPVSLPESSSVQTEE